MPMPMPMPMPMEDEDKIAARLYGKTDCGTNLNSFSFTGGSPLERVRGKDTQPQL